MPYPLKNVATFLALFLSLSLSFSFPGFFDPNSLAPFSLSNSFHHPSYMYIFICLNTTQRKENKTNE